MRLGIYLSVLSLAFCMFGGAAFATTKVASTNYVDNRIATENGNMEIKNAANTPVVVAQNSQTVSDSVVSSGDTNYSKKVREVVTVGWTDNNRTSKVRSGGQNGTTLVDVWVE